MNQCPLRKNFPRLRRALLTIVWLAVLVSAALAVFRRYSEFLAKGRIVPSFIVILGTLVCGGLFVLALIWDCPRLITLRKIRHVMPAPMRCILATLIVVTPLFLYTYLSWSEPFGAPAIRVLLYTLGIVTAASLLERDALNSLITPRALFQSALLFSVAVLLISHFRNVRDYPFSIGWSEGNRFWDYSVLFGRRLYDWRNPEPIPAYIDLGRQSLWGAIFLLPSVSITMMRSWNAILFTVPYLILGWALLRSDRNSSRTAFLCAGLFAMLFLNQGPIYTPLVLAITLVALARKLPAWFSLPLTFVAGAYAVMSRSTWIIAPPLFAAAMAFIETPTNANDPKKTTRWRNAIILALTAALGALFYLNRDSFLPGAENLNERTSGETIRTAEIETNDDLSSILNEASIEDDIITEAPSMFTPEGIRFFLTRQPLLWSRLFPNETYAPGILLGLLTAVLPLILLLLVWDVHIRKRGDGHPDTITRVLVLLMLLGLLAIGLIISVKIGGGSNLHNLDMFLIGLLIVAAMAWNDGMGKFLRERVTANAPVTFLVILAVLLPSLTTAMTIAPKVFPHAETTADALEKINAIIAENDGEDILFIDQRQLLTFGDVPKIPLIADYEKKWMMDEAMADHGAWFAPYLRDLRELRFNAIISEPLQIKFQGANLNFSEENDLFVKWVSIPTLCYYEPWETFPEQGVQILIPRTTPLEDGETLCDF